METGQTSRDGSTVVVIISANTEWQVIRPLFPGAQMQPSPFGEWFLADLGGGRTVILFHGGWGKISAAASAQYAIDRWAPALLVNLGTCGGFEGEIERGTIILVERTVVYDILEQMGDAEGAIAHYTTDLDLSWLDRTPEVCGHKRTHPQEVRRTLLVSGDRDLLPEDVPKLHAKYGTVAGDWESGAIAYVAARNKVRCLILRGVTDLVGGRGGEAYGNIQLFREGAAQIMRRLLDRLPDWIARAIP